LVVHAQYELLHLAKSQVFSKTIAALTVSVTMLIYNLIRPNAPKKHHVIANMTKIKYHKSRIELTVMENPTFQKKSDIKNWHLN
jgi:hypothetical protein